MITMEMLNTARTNVRTLESLMATMPPSEFNTSTLNSARENVAAMEAQLGFSSPVPPAAQTGQGIAPFAAPTGNANGAQIAVHAQLAEGQTASLEARVSALEQLATSGVSQQAVTEAAQIGMALMEAIGMSLTPEQAALVQGRLETSPEFFASQASKEALDIWLDAWATFEGTKS